MSMEALSQMHRDHRTWQSDDAFWRDQVREWQQQTSNAVADIGIIRAALQEHEQTLERHAAAIRLYEQESAEHECHLAESPAEATTGVAIGQHVGEASRHYEVRERHETLKEAHHTLMARWALLLRALRAEA